MVRHWPGIVLAMLSVKGDPTFSLILALPISLLLAKVKDHQCRLRCSQSLQLTFLRTGIPSLNRYIGRAG